MLRLKYILILLFKGKMLFLMSFPFLSPYFPLWSQFLHYDNPQKSICPVKFYFQVLMAKQGLDKYTAVPSTGQKPINSHRKFFFSSQGKSWGVYFITGNSMTNFKKIQRSLLKVVSYNFSTLTCFQCLFKLKYWAQLGIQYEDKVWANFLLSLRNCVLSGKYPFLTKILCSVF